MQKKVILSTCRIVGKFLAEQWIRNVGQWVSYIFENQLHCCEVKNVDDDDDDDDNNNNNNRIAHCTHTSKTAEMNSWFQTFALFWVQYVFFWVIPLRLNFICRRFGTLCLFHLHRQVVWSVTGGENGWSIRQPFSPPVTLHTTCLWRWNRQSVPKRRHIKFRRRGITQKKTYYTEMKIQNI